MSDDEEDLWDLSLPDLVAIIENERAANERLIAAVRMYLFALDAPQPGIDLDDYYEAGPSLEEAERELRDAAAGRGQQ